jgi:hypothetical protein
VDPVPDPLPLRKSGGAGDRTRDLCDCSQTRRPPDHRDLRYLTKFIVTAFYMYKKQQHLFQKLM